MLTLNLLPPQEKNNLALEKIQRWILFYAAGIFCLAAVFTVLLLAILSFVLIQQKTASYELQSTQKGSQWQELAEQEKTVKATSQQLEKISRIQKNHKYYSKFLIELTGLMPEGVRLENISVDKDGRVTLAGFGQTRDQVLSLKENLERSGFAEDVFSPLSNLTRQTEINFYFKLKLKPSALTYE